MTRDHTLHRVRRPWLRRLTLALFAAAGLLFLWVGAPRPGFEEAWVAPDIDEDVETWLRAREEGVPALRPGDGRAIVWADSAAKSKTPISLVYLHGFSADRHEMHPVVTDVATGLGANVYFARLTGHGRDGPAMAEASVEDWLADAVEALSVGERLGDRVVVIGTSTGGTLATWLAAREEGVSRVDALVLVSPNFHPRDRSARVLLLPWGERLARRIMGSERCWEPLNDRQERHWTTCYPVSVLTTMMVLVERVRTMDLSTVTAPVLVLFEPGDQVVDARETAARVDAMTGTTVRIIEVTGTTDPGRHVLAGDIVSPETNDEVTTSILEFVRRTVGTPDRDGGEAER